MSTMTSDRRKTSTFASEESRWRAVLERNAAAEGEFFYSVRTTGIYCRPTCGARRPRRENVEFHATAAAAERKGFRPCRRCHPRDEKANAARTAAITAACRHLETAEDIPDLKTLAAMAGLSPFHFHRLFKATTGVTPKAYAAARRTDRVRQRLGRGESVTTALHRAGFRSHGRFYDGVQRKLGMAPSRFRRGGEGETIRMAVAPSSLGFVLVAATDKGVCAIQLGSDRDVLVRDFRQVFHRAELIGSDRAFETQVAAVVRYIETPVGRLPLPLDLRGTLFQQRVWQELQRIPAGTTITYTELAARVGAPKSVRAVARACATNEISIAIPCHRVVRKSGDLAGYRWGIERKAALIEREARPRKE